MRTNESFIFESNFGNSFMGVLDSMVKEYKYRVITVLFDGNIEVIHKRFVDRDVTKESIQVLFQIIYFNEVIVKVVLA